MFRTPTGRCLSNAAKPISASCVSLSTDWDHLDHDPLPRVTAICLGVCLIVAVVILAAATLW
jgi:hypothetical protein